MPANSKRILSNGKAYSLLKWAGRLTVIAATSGLLFLFGYPFPYLLNNYRLDCFADQITNIPLPPLTQRVGMINKKFGNLGTCGKHGDYYAEFRVTTNLSYAQLNKYYSQFHIQIPDINNFASSLFRGLGTHGPIAIEINKVEETKDEYIVSSFDPDYWPNDFRCW